MSADRTPRQIIGDDAYMQLVFEGYEVIATNTLAAKDTALAEMRGKLAEARKTAGRIFEEHMALIEERNALRATTPSEGE